MTRKSDSPGPQRSIGAAAKARFLAALRRGERREDAAAGAGFTLTGFYGARRRDPAFKAQWTEALAASAERRVRAYAGRGEHGERGEVRIASANRRIYQRRRRRNVRFEAQRQAVFLAHFAATCDTKASAEAAGVLAPFDLLAATTGLGSAALFFMRATDILAIPTRNLPCARPRGIINGNMERSGTSGPIKQKNFKPTYILDRIHRSR